VLIAVWIALPEILQSHDYAADLTAKDHALARAQDGARIVFDALAEVVAAKRFRFLNAG